MQVMPATQVRPGLGVTPSNGTPQDTAREGRDYLAALTQKYGNPMYAAMAYNWGMGNMDKWLKSGADLSKVPDETLKYAYNYNKANPQQQPAATPAVTSVSTDPSKMTDEQLKQAYTQQQQQASSGGLWNNIKGAGLQAANLGVMGLEAVPGMASGIAHLGENLYGGQNLSQALQGAVSQTGQEFQQFGAENILNKMGVDTSGLHGTQGYQVGEKIMNLPGEAIHAAAPYLAQGIANQTGYDKPITPQDVQDVENLGNAAMIAAPIAHVLGRGAGVIPKDLETKLDTGNWDQPGTPPGPEATPTSNFETEPIPYRQYFQQPDLFGPGEGGEAPAGPGLGLRPDVETPEPGTRGGLSNARQMELQLNQGETLRVSPEGEVFPESVAGLRDQMSARVKDFNEAVQRGDEFTQGDLFNELSQRSYDQYTGEQPRALSEDEFTQTMQNLANQEGTRFELPEDPKKAYEQYLNTVSDEQGGLFDRPTIAKNFVETAAQAAVDRFVNDHPTVKANEQKLAAAQLAFDQARDSQTKMGAAGDLKRAQDLVDKSRENIAKFYKGDGRFGMYEKDGIIHMNSGVPIPDWIKNGLLKMLQGLHGVVVELADRAFQKFRNINSAAKVFQAGMRQAANERATRSVDTKVNEKQVDLIKKNVPGEGIKEFVPDDRPYQEAKQDLAAAPDMSSNWITRNITSQGGVWASALSKSPTVKWAFTHIQNAIKEADFTSKRLLTNNDDGLRTLIQKMNSREKGEIHALMDMDEGQTLRSDNELRQRGFNEKQRAYYQRFQEVMGEVYDRFNKAMVDAGMPPVDKRVAYMTSRFMGDFRSLVYQKGTTKPVGFIGGNTKWHVEGVKNLLEKQNPGKYDFEPTTLNRQFQGKVGPDMFQGYLNVLNHFQLNDPAMKEIMDTYRQYFTSNAAKAMGALKHAKEKGGIFGAEGKKAWLTQEQNAIEGMKSQLVYADHMIKWSAMQEAAGKVKEMMNDPDINQPNAKAYVKDYLSNALGQSTSKWAQGVSSVLDGVAQQTGIGPSVLRGLNSTQKSALLQLWLGFFRLPHALLTMTQFLQSNPAMAELVRSRGEGNFWANSYKGLGTTMQMALKQLNPEHKLSGFDQAIWDYNQKNQVFNANLTNHLADVNSSKAGRAFRHIMEANITYPEAAIRSSTFSIWAHTLKEAGYSTKDALGTAENLTRAALTDYRPSERPLVFGKMGMMGDIASTLTRFKMNQISQHQYFGKEAIGGKNFTPMAALLASSIAFAGVSGLLGFNYADEAYQQITHHVLGKPDTLKAVLLRNLPDWANYGMFAQFGINMQGSFSNADTIPDNPISTLFPTSSTLMDMGKSAYEAAYYHDDTTMKKMLYNFSPTSIKGIEENQLFSKDVGNGNKLYINPNTEKGQAIRTPGEQMTRNLAFHPITEARKRDIDQAKKTIDQGYSNLREKDLKRIEHQFAQGTVTDADRERFKQDWTSHRGDVSAANSITEYLRNQKLTDFQRDELAGAQGNVQAKESLKDIFAMKGNVNR